MLCNLYIENIAVIQQADIEFSSGLTVLSGETGAGKSMIIDALGAILGGRTSRELIRTGQNKACVAATFTQLSDDVLSLLAEMGFEAEEGQLLVRRELYADGRNQCRVNGKPASLSNLKALGERLVSIYGQHDGQHLMNEQLHMDYLDLFGGLEQPIARYLSNYEALLQLNRKMKALSMSTAEKERRRALLPARIEELKKANVQPGEQEELLALRQELQNGEKIAQGLADAALFLDGNDGTESVADRLSQAVKALGRGARYSAAAGELEKRMREIAVLAADLSGELADELTRLNYAPERLEETERRLDQISKLCIKYSQPADQLQEHLAALEEELDTLDHLDDSLDELKAEYASMRAALYQEAGELHELRCKAAERMAELIQRELRDLDLKNARFCAEVEDLRTETQARFTKKGTDTVRFLLSANAGEDLKPLAKVASGGELSRIMLAMKTVLSAGEQGMSAVFDEVDAGVSGRAAQRVAEKLQALSNSRQVLCITHLPQIAAAADHHLLIAKTERDGRTFTEVTPLDREGRKREIARIIGGAVITEKTLANAEEMLKTI
ncbi:MAG: DNA repair protein RecN [Clostridia bacterium]|nr:DNA repair protein RecN [Clostridia bacterium]